MTQTRSNIQNNNDTTRLAETGVEHVASASLENQYSEDKTTALTPLAHTDNVLTVLSRSLYDLTVLSSAISGLSIVHTLRVLIPLLDAVVMIIMCLFAAFLAATTGNQNTATKIIKTAAPLGVLAVVIGSFAISSFILPIALFSFIFVNRTWDFINGIRNRFFGEWKKNLTESQELKESYEMSIWSDDLKFELNNNYSRCENKLRAHRLAFAEDIHSLISTAISLTGVILLIPPFTSIGLCILFGIGVYGMLDKFGYNPLRWIANKIFNHPFQPIAIEQKAVSTTAVVNKQMLTIEEKQEAKAQFVVEVEAKNKDTTEFLTGLNNKFFTTPPVSPRKNTGTEKEFPSVIERRASLRFSGSYR